MVYGASMDIEPDGKGLSTRDPAREDFAGEGLCMLDVWIEC